MTNNKPEKFIFYYRVSTKKQGESGLGLQAQKRDISIYFSNYAPKNSKIIRTFKDIESGSYNERPQLTKAIALAKKEDAILLVARLDRLSRKVSFVASLMDDKKLRIKVACMPNADKFQLHIYAALAEQERDFISMRTKAALKEAKERGVKLGGLRDSTKQMNEAVKAQATARAEKLLPVIRPMREQGMSLQKIANHLNELGYQTARGGMFTAMQVKRTIDRG